MLMDTIRKFRARLLLAAGKVRNVLLGCSLVEATVAALEIAALILTLGILAACGAEIFWPLMVSQLIFHVLTLVTFGIISWLTSKEDKSPAAAQAAC